MGLFQVKPDSSILRLHYPHIQVGDGERLVIDKVLFAHPSWELEPSITSILGKPKHVVVQGRRKQKELVASGQALA